MAVKETKGRYVVKNDSDARLLMDHFVELKHQQWEIEQQTGYKEVCEDASRASKALADYLASKNKRKLETDSGVVELIERHGRMWVWDGSENVPEEVEDYTPLVDLLPREKWKYVSKRVADPDRIDQAIKSGKIKMDDVEDALVHFITTRFVQPKK